MSIRIGDSMLELKNVSKVYHSKKSIDTIALKDISLKFPSHGMVFILGKSGSGKSTLLNILGGLDVPSSGDIFFFHKDITKFSSKEYDSYRNKFYYSYDWNDEKRHYFQPVMCFLLIKIILLQKFM